MIRYALLFVVCLWTPMIRLVPGAEVEITLTPSTNELRAEDPLFVTVRIANRSGHDVSYNHAISAVGGTLWFEARQVGANEFQRFSVPFQNTGYGTGVWRRLASNDELESQEVISRHGFGMSPFANAGTFELRATLRDIEGISGTSLPITVRVAPIPPAEQAAIVDAAQNGLAFGTTGIPAAFDTDRLAALRGSLGDCVLRSTLDWMIDLLNLRRLSESPAEFETARAEFSQLRGKMDLPTRKCVTLKLISEYIELRRYPEAWKELLALKFNSSEKETLWNRFIQRAVIDEIRRERVPGAGE